jgi:hypothetical protein
MPASVDEISGNDDGDRQGRANSRSGASGHRSRSHSEAGTHRTDHTTNTTVTHVHVDRRNPRKKQSKAKKEVHKKKAKEVPLNVLEAEVKERRAKQEISKQEQLQNNQQIDELYRKELDKWLGLYKLKNAYDQHFSSFFQTKKEREEVFYNMQDKSEEDEKRFREYWRKAEADKLAEFLTNNHVAAAPLRRTIANTFYEKLKESKAKVAAVNSKTIAALAAAAHHLHKGGETDGVTKESVFAAPAHMYDESLWGRKN